MVSAASAAPTMTRSRRSRASNAASLIARVPVASGGVRPVVLVVDPVRLIELDGEVSGRRPERALPCLALLPDEASGQIDVDDVVLARAGFFKASPRPSPTPSMRNVLLRPL